MCLYSTPSCHRAQFHCDISISHSCVTLGVCGCPDASLTWFYLFKHHTLRAAVGHTPNPAWHASHQIWVLAASFVFNWSLGWLMSKPTVNLWPPQQGDSTIPSLSLSLATPVLTKSWFIWLFIYFNNPPTSLFAFFSFSLYFFLVFCSSLPCRAPHHHIQSVAFQTANSLFGKLLCVCQALWGGQDVPLMVCWFLWTLALMMPSRAQNLAGERLVQSCPGLRIAALTTCAKLWPNCVYSWLGFVLHTWMSSPQGVVMGSLLLAWDWMDIGAQPKPN